METQDFEKTLLEMSKPEVNKLKHQEILSEAIARAKNKSVLSWWWISIPVFIFATLLMKSFFFPGSSFLSNFRELRDMDKLGGLMLFGIIPGILIIFNLISIRKIYILSGNPGLKDLLKTTWFNTFIIIISLFILLVYSL